MIEEQEYTYDVFISYSHRDGEWVRHTLLPRLEGAGLRVGIDYRDFRPGTSILIEMERAVLQSRQTLLVLTPDYLASEWVRFENILASTLDPAARQRRIIPLLLKPCELPMRIRALHYADFTHTDDRTQNWERLLNSLGARLPEPAEARIESLVRQLQTHQSNLARLQEMQARYGIEVPVALLNEIDEEQEAIERLEMELSVARWKPISALSKISKLLSDLLIPRKAGPDSDRELLSAERLSLERRLQQYMKNLYLLEERRARYGMDTPIWIENEIADVKGRIAELKKRLSGLEVQLSESFTEKALIEFLRSAVWQWVSVIIAILGLITSLLVWLLPRLDNVSLPSLPMPATWIVLLVLTALTTLGIYSSRVVLPRWTQVRINRERERDWQSWEEEIERLLFDKGTVGPEKLVETPREHKAFAIEKYFRDHRNQLAISLRKRDDRLELENRHLASRFTTSWDKASAYLTSLNKGSFLEACSDILDCLHNLGIHRCETQPTTFGRLHGFVVEVPSLSINIPPRFPVVFTQKEEFSVDEVEDVLGLKNQMGMEGAYFIVLVVFNRATDVEEEIQTEGSVYGIEFCILDRELIWDLLISRTGEKDLTKMLMEKASLLRICPYRIYGPAPDPVFFGREREISQALASVKETSTAIVGGRKIGKTSTLNKIERALSKRDDVYSIYLDCYRIRDYEAFFDKLDTNLGELELPRAKRNPLRFDSVVGSTQQKIGSKRLVFLMDEVDALLDYDTRHDEDLFGTFRSLSQEGRCSFVLCGAKVLYFSLHNPKSALFNFCDTLRLRYLDAENSAKLVTVPMARMGVNIENERVLVDKIISITSGHPNLIQFICRRMVELIDREHRRNITLDDFTVVSESAEFREFFTEVIWGDTTPLERLVMLSLIEGKELTENEMMDALHDEEVIVDLRQLQQAIRGLSLYSIIVRVGNKCAFVAKAFPDIVKYSQNIDLLRPQYKREWEETRE
jgi:hypothetical protein